MQKPAFRGGRARGGHRRLTKTLLIMQLTAILLTVACLNVAAKGVSQNVTFTGKNVPLSAVFTSVEKQTGYVFFYTDVILDAAHPVTVEAKNISLEHFLSDLLKDQSLVYEISGKNVIISKKPAVPTVRHIDEILTAPTPIVIRILDENGQPLSGASVSVRKNTALANAKGEATLNLEAGDVLTISFVGYDSKKVTISQSQIESGTISSVLAVASNPLDQVVVQAYNKSSQRYSTGANTTITSKQIENKVITNPLQALQGEIPGLVINQNSGVANAGITVQIRGQNSFAKGQDPLYVIDGVPYFSQLLPLINTTMGTSGNLLTNPNSSAGSPLSFINPADIETISVLRDADATSIYGSRAANGAIIITTKKGKAGSLKLNINAQHGFGKVSRMMDLLDAKEYLQMRHEALYNDSVAGRRANTIPGATDYDLNGTWDTTRSTDWQKTFLGGTAKYTDIQGSVSGGSDQVQYLVGMGYHKETTIYPADYGNQRGSLHFSLNTSSKDRKFRMQLSGSYMTDMNRLPVVNLATAALRLSPVAPALYNPDGSLNWALKPDSTATWTNPLNFTASKPYVKTGNLVSSLQLNYELLTGLFIKTNLGYTNMSIKEYQPFPLAINAPADRKFATRSANYSNGNTNSWIIEPQLNYRVRLGNGNLDALVGTTLQEKNDDQVKLYGEGYSTDLLLEDPRSAVKLSSSGTVNTMYRYNALFGILNYRLYDRYIINLAARRDGSSRFGSQNQFHNFGSVAAAWIFSSEPWLAHSLSMLSFGKLNASYGTTGNDQIGDYQFINTSNSNNDVTYQQIAGLIPVGIPNPYLQWEETKKLQFGIDVGFNKDKILLNATYYQNRSSNQLLGYQIPFIAGAGVGNYIRNFPATIQNSGWEFSVTSTNIKNSNFGWTSKLNLTIARNKLLAFPNLTTSSYASSFIIGQPVSGILLYKYLRVNPQSGIYEFETAKGETTSTPDFATDRTVMLDLNPTFYGGLNNDITFKNFQIGILIQLSKLVVGNGYPGVSIPGRFASNSGNQPQYVMDRWKAIDDVAPIQKFSTTSPATTAFSYTSRSTINYTDTWFARVKNISVGYNLPDKWMQPIRMQAARIFVNAQNFLTFTNYKGLDPESGNATIAPLKIIVFGLNVTL